MRMTNVSATWRSNTMTYDESTTTTSFDVGDSQPFFCDIVDTDGEMLRFEWNKASSPCVSIIKLLNALLELNEQGMKNE